VKTEVREVVENITKNLHVEISVEYTNGTPGDQFGIFGSPIFAHSLLEWQSKVSFEIGMKKMIKWAKKQF